MAVGYQRKREKKVGARPKIGLYSPEIIKRRMAGLTIKDSIAGLINESTYFAWYNVGLEDLNNDIESEYSEFCKLIDNAVKKFKETLVNSIKKHSKDDWRAASWLLERAEPDHYHLKQKVDMVQQIEVTQKALLELPDNGRRKVAEKTKTDL